MRTIRRVLKDAFEWYQNHYNRWLHCSGYCITSMWCHGPNHEYHHCWLPKLRAERVTINPANIIKVLAIWEHPNVHLKEFPWPRNYIYFLDGKKTNAAENHTKRQKQWCKWEIHLMTLNTIKLYRQDINKARQNKQTNKKDKLVSSWHFWYRFNSLVLWKN